MMDDIDIKKKVDFSPYTYRRLLQNLKRVWQNIEYNSWAYKNWNDKGLSEEQIEELRPKFERLKKDIQTKIDLVIARINKLIEDSKQGKVDFDYTITCYSVGSNFSLEDHLNNFKPQVVMKKLFKENRDDYL